MKCSKCGHKARSLAAMAKHYRKKHPGAMKRRSAANPGPRVMRFSKAMKNEQAYWARKQARDAAAIPNYQLGDPRLTASRFCPHCGGFLG